MVLVELPGSTSDHPGRHIVNLSQVLARGLLLPVRVLYPLQGLPQRATISGRHRISTRHLHDCWPQIHQITDRRTCGCFRHHRRQAGNEWDPQGATDILRPHAIGSQTINVSPYGVYDMLGNEVEWVADWYADDYYVHSPFHNPTGPEEAEHRVVRSLGGGQDLLGKIRSGLPSRSWTPPDHPFGGFRCAYSPEQN